MSQRRVDSWWQQWTCVGGTCGPPATPARNRFERALDAYTSVTAPLVRGCLVFVTFAVVGVTSSALGPAGGMLVEAGFFGLIATYCPANFARCQEAHCIVTCLGYLTLAVVGFAASRWYVVYQYTMLAAAGRARTARGVARWLGSLRATAYLGHIALEVVLADGWRDDAVTRLLHGLGQLDPPEHLLDVRARHALAGAGQLARVDVVGEHAEPRRLVRGDEPADHLGDDLGTPVLVRQRHGKLDVEAAGPDERVVHAL